jgi:hypothetical protein
MNRDVLCMRSLTKARDSEMSKQRYNQNHALCETGHASSQAMAEERARITPSVNSRAVALLQSIPSRVGFRNASGCG